MLQYTSYANIFRLDEAAINALKERAEKGDAQALFGLGRYYYCTNLDQRSMALAEDCLSKAQAMGLAEADVALAIMYRRGALGRVDRVKAQEMLQNAAERGCKYAIEILIMDMIYGMYGKPANTTGAIEWLEKLIKEDDYPMWSYLMGCAVQRTNDMDSANLWFNIAVKNGIIEAYSDLAYSILVDADNEPANYGAYISTLKRGADMGDGVCTMLLALSKIERYDEAGMYERLLMGRELLLNLERAIRLGCNSAACYLGCIYAEGRYGMDIDYGKAWQWFVRGSELLSSDCYEAMCEMIEKGIIKESCISLEMCALKGARCGSEGLTSRVVEIYRQGGLTEYAEEIEQYYMTNQ